MGATQICRNCNGPVKFNEDEDRWLHVTYRSAHTMTWDGEQCLLYAQPTSTRDTSMYGLGTTTG
jgi:hypothetical protein